MNADGAEPARQEECGDPACWVGRVCPECGAFADEAPPTTCVRCGTELPGPELFDTDRTGPEAES